MARNILDLFLHPQEGGELQAGAGEHCCTCGCHGHDPHNEADGGSEEARAARQVKETLEALSASDPHDMLATENEALIQEELAITKILHQRLEREDCLAEAERESVAYRLAEIMTSAKDLYTVVMPRLLGLENEGEKETAADSRAEDAGQALAGSASGEDETYTMFDELAGARMAFMHFRDLLDDFDAAFLEAMASQRELDGNTDTLPDPDPDFAPEGYEAEEGEDTPQSPDEDATEYN